MNSLSRRSFLSQTAAAAAAAVVHPRISRALAPNGTEHPPTFLDLTRPPDLALASLETSPQAIPLRRSGPSWQAPGLDLRTSTSASGTLDLTLTAPNLPIKQLHLRWLSTPSLDALYLGDAWERSYGDLAWRSLVPERVLPWYFAAHHPSARLTHTYGVRTGAAALCFWQVDPSGVSLTLDLSNGGSGVLLGGRDLHAATILTRPGEPGERPDMAIAALCRLMCSNPRLPPGPIYGTNDWYYAYGRNSAEGILRDTDLIASLSPAPGTGPTSLARPFSVIDDGWKPAGTPAGAPGRNPAFPDMPRLARDIRDRGVRPGIWIRPTEAPADASPNLLLPNARFRNPAAKAAPAFDPTIPEALDLLLAKLREVVAWGYDLVKHDFSTYDLLGQWGSAMGASPTRPGWHFHDRSRTNAEILLSLYQSLRSTAGDKTLLLGCNTVGHLGASFFEAQRTGDDTSGHDWDRTRRMGVNTLAFRLPQNRTFFVVDADCVGITRDIPWSLNAQWLDLLARSGTALFISPAPDAVGPPNSDQRKAIAEAFAIAAANQTSGYPTDALDLTTPEHWQFTIAASKPEPRTYPWCPPAGCDPSPV